MMFSDGNGGWYPWAGVLMVETLTLRTPVDRGAVFPFQGLGSGRQGPAPHDPEQVLKERFAGGEIEPEECRLVREPVNTRG